MPTVEQMMQAYDENPNPIIDTLLCSQAKLIDEVEQMKSIIWEQTVAIGRITNLLEQDRGQSPTDFFADFEPGARATQQDDRGSVST